MSRAQLRRFNRRLTHRSGLVLAAAFLLAGSLSAQTPPSQDSASARQAIERAWATIIDQCKRGDWAGLTAGFTPHGVYVNPDWPDVAGHKALRAMYEKEGGPIRLIKLTRNVTHFLVEGDIAMEGAESTEEWHTPGKPGSDKFALRYLYVWKRQPDGKWRILYLMETNPSPSSKPRS